MKAGNEYECRTTRLVELPWRASWWAYWQHPLREATNPGVCPPLHVWQSVVDTCNGVEHRKRHASEEKVADEDDSNFCIKRCELVSFTSPQSEGFASYG